MFPFDYVIMLSFNFQETVILVVTYDFAWSQCGITQLLYTDYNKTRNIKLIYDFMAYYIMGVIVKSL